MIKLRQKIMVYILIFSTLLSAMPWQLWSVKAQESPDDPDSYDGWVLPPEEEGSVSEDPNEDPQRENLASRPQMDPLMREFKEQFIQDISAGMGTAAYTDPYYPTNKIILNATDKIDVDQYYVLQSALPDLKTNLDELSALTGTMVEELMTMQQERPDDFQKLVDSTSKEKFTNEYIKNRILADMDLLAALLNLASPSQAIYELQNNRTNVLAAIDKALEYKLDTKIVETLNYLVRPKNDTRGGAGHWRIRVARLKKNYSRDETRYSRESNGVIAANREAEQKDSSQIQNSTVGEVGDHDTAQLEQDAEQLGANPNNTLASGQIQDEDGETISDFLVSSDTIQTNVSAHFKGQAVDIDQIDSIKCTKIERTRIGSDKKTAMQPYNIKLSWQNAEGYAADQEDLNTSFNSIMWNTSQSSLLAMLSELNVDIENIDDMNSANFSDLASTVGRAFFSQALNAPGGDMWNFPLEETLRKLGGVLIADKLSLDRKPFLDTTIDSIDGLTEAIGRSAIEKKLRLPYGTLKGTGREQMLINAGKYRILSELRLPTDILDTPPADKEDLYQRIGSRIVETGLGLNKGSLYKKNSLAEVKDAAGRYKIEAILAYPANLDAEFNLPTGSGSGLKSGGVSVQEFNRLVATAALIASSHNYPNYNSDVGSGQIPNDIGKINYRDEMFNLPEGTIDAFVANNLTPAQYKNIGIFALARIFENDDLSRANLTKWLENPTRDFRIMGQVQIKDANNNLVTQDGIVDLPAETYASMLGISRNEVYFILGNPAENATAGAFKRLGEKILFEAIRKSDLAKRATDKYLAEHPDLQEGIAQYEFYKQRIDNIKSHLDSFRDKSNQLRSAVQGIEDTIYSLGDKQQTNAMLDQLMNIIGTDTGDNSTVIVALAQQIIQYGDPANSRVTQLNEIVDTYADRPLSNLRSALNSFNSELQYIMKNAYEIITGTEQNNFNLNDMRIGQMGFGRMDLSGTSVSTMDLILLLTRKITPQDFFISLASAKIADELDLPPRALQYAAKLVKSATEKKGNPKTAFFRAIGLAALELKINQNNSSGGGTTEVASFSNNAADVGEASTIQELRSKLATTFNGNNEKANAVIASGLGLPGYNLDVLMRGDFGAWASARPKAEANDKELNLPIGTTENFIRGSSLKSAVQIGVSDDDYRQFATKLGVSEAALRLFIAKANGEDNPAVNSIYYVDRNRYMVSNDSQDVCAGKPIPDNVFLYYDQDGMHYFNSYPEANEYVKAHEDRKFGDFVTEISSRLWAIFSGADAGNHPAAIGDLVRSQEHIAGLLQAFIKGESNAVFNDPDTSDRIKVYLFDDKSIPTDLTDKFFSRSSIEGTIPENGKIDFLKTLGIALLKNFAISYIGQTVGLSIGSTRITVDDIYDIFNGNSRQVFYRIGGSILDSELGLEKGTFESVLAASTADARRCAMDRAATQLLGDLLGIPNLRLEGSLFNNIGGGKVEQLLGFPEGSFRGKNIAEMIDVSKKNYVPIITFYKGFQLPVPIAIKEAAKSAINGMGQDYINRYKNASFYEQVEVLSNYIEALGESGGASQLISHYRLIDKQLREFLPSLLKSELLKSNDVNQQVAYVKSAESSLYSGYSRTSDSDMAKMVRALNMRLTSIDSATQQPAGTAAKLLLDEISPDSLRQATSRIAIEDIGVEALKKFFNIETDIDAGDLRLFKAALLGEEIGDRGDMTTSQRLSIIYSFLTKAFGWKLDEKAGFTPGTIAAVIADPSRAPALLMQAGARMLDRQLGIENDRLNFAHFVDIYWNDNEEDINYCNSAAAKANPNDASLSDCLNRRRWHNVTASARYELESHIAGQVSGFLTKMSGVDVEVTVPNPFGHGGTQTEIVHTYGVNLPLDYIYDIFKGDLRVLGVMATIRGIGAVLGDNNGRYALGEGSEDFRFIYQDVVYAYYGNPMTDSMSAQRAREQVYAENNAANLPLYENFQQNPENTWNVPWGSANSGVTNITAAGDSVSAVTIYADLNYAVPVGADITAPTAPVLRPEPMPETYLYPPGQSVPEEDGWATYNAAHQEWLIDRNAWLMQNENYNRIMDEADKAATAAAARARDLHRQYLEYRVMDCMLRKLDNHIPAGFAWAVMKGNGFVRTSALLNYVENWIRYDTDWGQYVPQGSLTAIWQFFDGPVGVRGNIDTLINVAGAGVFGLVDDYLLAHAPKVFGLTFKQGTAQALFAFAKTGHIDQAVTIGGKEYSIAKVYENWTEEFVGGKIGAWADKKLGLPPGSTYSFYKSVTGLIGAQRLYRQASLLKVGGAVPQNMEALAKSLKIADPSHLTDADITKLKANFKQQMTNLKAELVTLVITIVFGKQIAAAEQALGLVPGTGAIAVGLLVNYLMGAAFNPVGAILFVVINLFGVYKVDILCTADGYYPELTPKISSSTIDNDNLGVFDGMDENAREENYVKAAQYKADRLAQDVYEMPTLTGKKNLVPLQVMTGRQESVFKAKPLVLDTACKKVGASTFMKNSKGEELAICANSYVGIWVNPQSAEYTHLGM